MLARRKRGEYYDYVYVKFGDGQKENEHGSADREVRRIKRDDLHTVSRQGKEDRFRDDG